MSYTFYKLVHLIGIFFLLLSLGVLFGNQTQGREKNFPFRRFFYALHGLGVLFVFVAGFGLLARTGFPMTSGWVLFKIGAWLLIGLFPVALKTWGRKKKGALILFCTLLCLLISTLYMVEYKTWE